MYDKSAESKLKESWTRIEITYGNPLCDDFSENLAKKVPIIKQRCSDISHANEANEKLSSTDQVLIALFQKIKDPEFIASRFKILDRKKQRRLKPYIYADEMDFQFDLDAIHSVMLNTMNMILPDCFVAEDRKFINEKYILEEIS